MVGDVDHPPHETVRPRVVAVHGNGGGASRFALVGDASQYEVARSRSAAASTTKSPPTMAVNCSMMSTMLPFYPF